VNLVRGVMSEILTKGRVVRGWIGIVPTDIDAIEAQRFNLARPGVVVAKLYVGSPAALVGMEPRDIILTVNGARGEDASQDTLTRIATAKPGSESEDHGNSRHRTFFERPRR
jgi:S1-C subfamily serine protease